MDFKFSGTPKYVNGKAVFIYKGIKATGNWNTHWIRHVTPGKKGINVIQHYTD